MPNCSSNYLHNFEIWRRASYMPNFNSTIHTYDRMSKWMPCCCTHIAGTRLTKVASWSDAWVQHCCSPSLSLRSGCWDSNERSLMYRKCMTSWLGWLALWKTPIILSWRCSIFTTCTYESTLYPYHRFQTCNVPKIVKLYFDLKFVNLVKLLTNSYQVHACVAVRVQCILCHAHDNIMHWQMPSVPMCCLVWSPPRWVSLWQVLVIWSALQQLWNTLQA